MLIVSAERLRKVIEAVRDAANTATDCAGIKIVPRSPSDKEESAIVIGMLAVWLRDIVWPDDMVEISHGVSWPPNAAAQPQGEFSVSLDCRTVYHRPSGIVFFMPHHASEGHLYHDNCEWREDRGELCRKARTAAVGAGMKFI